MKPNAQKYIATKTVEQMCVSTGLKRKEIAHRLGITDRTLRNYTAGLPTPYCVIYCLQMLAKPSNR